MKYAVIETSTIHIPGDERSRTNPGHGYPEHTQTVTNMREFADEEKMLEYVKRRSSAYGGFKGRVIQFEELDVRGEVTVSIKR